MEKRYRYVFGGLIGGVVLLHGGAAGGVIQRLPDRFAYRAFGVSRNAGEEIPS